MKRKLIAFAVSGALTLGAFALYAEKPEHGQGHGKGGKWGNPLEYLTKDLDLTPDQQAKVGPIVDQAKPQIKAIHQEAMQKARAVMEDCATQIRPLLTPPQQEKFDQIKKEHEDKMNTMRERHQDPED